MSLADHLIVPDWPAPKQVRAVQTTRQGGVSGAPYDSLNLGSHVGDAPLAVARNRMLLNTLFPSEPVWLEQVHGILVANADMAGCRPRADACIARNRAAVCVVMTADCLPVLLCDKQGSVVGAAHAGWKGLAAGVIEATVSAMNVSPQNLMAWLGPAISQETFEVGDEVRAAFVAAHPQAASAFIPGQQGKWFADIYALARLRLNALGVTQIYGGGHCDTLLRSSRLHPQGVRRWVPGGIAATLTLREQSPAALDETTSHSTRPSQGDDQVAGYPAPDGSTAPCQGGYCTYQERDKFFSYRRDGATGRMGTFIWLE